MGQYVIRRLLLIPLLLLGITIIDYFFLNLAPGDPVTAMIDPEMAVSMSQEDLDAVREALGLNQPVYVRYTIWLMELVQGNMGYSITRHLPVADLMVTGVKNTITLTGLSLLLSTLIGVTLGVVSALHQYSLVDYIFTVVGFVGYAMPNFFFAMLLIAVFAIHLGWFPTGGLRTPGMPPSFSDYLAHLALPLFALSINGTASVMRYTRNSVLEVMREDYVITARSKGLSEQTITVRHILRNALLPVITITGVHIPRLVAGSVLIEAIFSIPGIGGMTVQATASKDYPLLMGSVLISGVMVLFSNLLADLAYAIADPRIRY